MRIYFYDGDLKNAAFPQSLYNNKVHTLNVVDGRYGPKANTEQLDETLKLPRQFILTNSLIALSHKYGWNEEENHTDIYLYVEELDKYVRIDELTDKDIRYAHNIEKMYLSGVFDEIDLQKGTEV